mmetsp:Transcript_1892/g.5331  ORF Transcript_1892/g.5331 Transcript_1892/m.5331 type:complete len:223 (-) Transcript_1892:567-1235(-)
MGLLYHSRQYVSLLKTKTAKPSLARVAIEFLILMAPAFAPATHFKWVIHVLIPRISSSSSLLWSFSHWVPFCWSTSATRSNKTTRSGISTRRNFISTSRQKLLGKGDSASLSWRATEGQKWRSSVCCLPPTSGMEQVEFNQIVCQTVSLLQVWSSQKVHPRKENRRRRTQREKRRMSSSAALTLETSSRRQYLEPPKEWIASADRVGAGSACCKGSTQTIMC